MTESPTTSNFIIGAELYEKGVALVKAEQKASTSFLSRKLEIGYVLAARLMEELEKNGVVSSPDSIGKREVLNMTECPTTENGALLPEIPAGWRWHSMTLEYIDGQGESEGMYVDNYVFVMLSIYGSALMGQGPTPRYAVLSAIGKIQK